MCAECQVDALDLDRFVNDAALLPAADDDREALRPCQRGDARFAPSVARRLHHGDRADILARRTRFMHEQVDMRLEKPAGSELQDAAGHIGVVLTRWTSDT